MLKILIIISLYYFFIIYSFFKSYFNKRIRVIYKYDDNGKYYIIGDKKYSIKYPWFKVDKSLELYNNITVGGFYNINGYDDNKIYSIIHS